MAKSWANWVAMAVWPTSIASIRASVAAIAAVAALAAANASAADVMLLWNKPGERGRRRGCLKK
jgi:hypothetical protein